ncbi:MAG: tetratricopeptide repeat protein [Chloroflexi bacterium]|nr:tetratricopeptide repeat protein [Chloroflexota bacterium]
MEQANAGNGALAISIIDAAFEAYPGDYELYIWRAAVYLSAFSDYELALDDLARVSVDQMNESNAYQFFKVAMESFLWLEDAVSAIRLGRELDRLNMHHAPLRVMLGMAFNRVGDYESALEQFEIAIDDSSVYSPAYAMRSITYDQLGEPELAQNDRDRASRLSQSGGDVYVRRAATRTPTPTAFVDATPSPDPAPTPTPTPTTNRTPQASPTTVPAATPIAEPTPWIFGPQRVRAVASLYDQEFEFAVVDFLTGDAAYRFLKNHDEYNIFYDEAASGEEYVLVRVEVIFVGGGPPGTPFIVDQFDFEIIQLDGHELAFVYIPEEIEIDVHLQRGESKQGWIGGIRIKDAPLLLGYRHTDLDEYTVFSLNCVDTQGEGLRLPAIDLCFAIDEQIEPAKPDTVVPEPTPVADSPEFKELGAIVNREFGVVTQQLAATTRHILNNQIAQAAEAMDTAADSCIAALDAVGGMDELSPEPVWSVIYVHVLTYCDELDRVYEHLVDENVEQADLAMGRANAALQQALPLVPPGSW